MFSDLLLLCLIMCIGMSYVFWLFLRTTFVDDCCCWFDCCVLLGLRCVCIGGLVLELIVVGLLRRFVWCLWFSFGWWGAVLAVGRYLVKCFVA